MIETAERKGGRDELLVFAMAVESGAPNLKRVLIGLQLQGICDAIGSFLYPTSQRHFFHCYFYF